QDLDRRCRCAALPASAAAMAARARMGDAAADETAATRQWPQGAPRQRLRQARHVQDLPGSGRLSGGPGNRRDVLAWRWRWRRRADQHEHVDGRRAMSKTALLKNSTAVVKSEAKLPATKPKRTYGDCDAFVANADNLVLLFARVDSVIERLCFDDQFEWIEWPDHRSLDLKEAGQKIASAKYGVESARRTVSELPWASKHLAE